MGNTAEEGDCHQAQDVTQTIDVRLECLRARAYRFYDRWKFLHFTHNLMSYSDQRVFQCVIRVTLYLVQGREKNSAYIVLLYERANLSTGKNPYHYTWKENIIYHTLPFSIDSKNSST